MSLAMLTHTPATTDLCDAHEDRLADGRLRVLPDVFRLALGQRSAACGPAVTLKLFEDNTGPCAMLMSWTPALSVSVRWVPARARRPRVARAA